jgi:predicted ATPase
MDAHRAEPATKKDLDQVKQELTDKIDANGAKIDVNGRKIDANSAKIDRIALQVIENRE